MKKVISIIIMIVAVLGIGASVFYTKSITAPKYNDTYVNGNTAGNLYNGGLYCEYDGMIYFANPKDGNRLYCVGTDGSDMKMLSEDSAGSINVDENYVYYVRTGGNGEEDFSFMHFNTNSLCKVRRDGKGEVIILDDAPAMYASLVGNYIYYLHYDTETATTLYRVKIDGTEKAQVSPNPYFTCSTNGQYIYYNGLEGDHNIYKYDTATGSQTLLYEGNCWMPIVEGNTIYFLDCVDSYSLAKVNLTTGEKTTICDDWVDCYNVYNGTIYFQRSGSDPALCKVDTDGSNYAVIRTGVYNSINIADGILYFKDFSTEELSRMPL